MKPNYTYHNGAVKAFQSLDEGLRPFVKQEMLAVYKEHWLDNIANSVKWEREEPIWDTLALLHTIRVNWTNVFKMDRLRGPEEIGKVSALIDWRHRIQGHSPKPVDKDEAYSAINSMHHLLKSIGAITEVGEVEQLLISFRPPPLDEVAISRENPVQNEIPSILPTHINKEVEAELQRLENIVSSTASPPGLTTAGPKFIHSARQSAILEDVEEAKIQDSVVLLRIDRSYRFGITATELYAATRGDWAMTPEKRFIKPRYAMAVVSFVIREVYLIDTWHPATDSSWGPSRCRFDGAVALDKADFVGKSVQSYINRRSSNPVRYVNC